MSSDEVVKTCPSCKLKDKTSFSKCRSCGTRYDAYTETPEDDGTSGGIQGRALFNQKVLVVVIGAACALGFFQWSANSIKEARVKELAPLVSSIKNADKPRVLEFYADWCGPCRSYGPAVDALKAKYAGRIDVERINIESRNPWSRVFGVRAIPRTITFDKQGNQVDSISGDIGEERLEKLMVHLLAI